MTWAQSHSIKACPRGMKNSCPKKQKTEGKLWNISISRDSHRSKQAESSPQRWHWAFSELFVFHRISSKIVSKLSCLPNVLQWTSVLICFFCLAEIFLERLSWGCVSLWVFFLDFRDEAFKNHPIQQLRADSFPLNDHNASPGPAWKMQQAWSLLCLKLIIWQSALSHFCSN